MIHLILASISVSIAVSIAPTPACHWRNPPSPERGRAGFDSPARSPFCSTHIARRSKKSRDTIALVADCFVEAMSSISTDFSHSRSLLYFAVHDILYIISHTGDF